MGLTTVITSERKASVLIRGPLEILCLFFWTVEQTLWPGNALSVLISPWAVVGAVDKQKTTWLFTSIIAFSVIKCMLGQRHNGPWSLVVPSHALWSAAEF